MTRKMLIDATHAEETRVAVVDGNRLVDFDYESKVRKQLKGSIFLAKVTRVEPSLQAAFVNFGGNRHGFLPFSEIHPDYYRIPIADREALLAEQQRELEALRAEEEAMEAAEEAKAAGLDGGLDDSDDDEDDEDDDDIIEEVGGESAVRSYGDDEEDDADAEGASEDADTDLSVGGAAASENNDNGSASFEAAPAFEGTEQGEDADAAIDASLDEFQTGVDEAARAENADAGDDAAVDGGEAIEDASAESGDESAGSDRGRRRRHGNGNGRGRGRGRGRNNRMASDSRRVEIVGGDGIEGDHPIRPSNRRNYKIQEVVKRGQIMLVQVSKEERGNKGAAVTSYLSLPGRYCVLMPNSSRAGGVSRKIANFKERRRMREILDDLQVPEGMSVIMRTAGMSRNKTEIKRDLDYLMRLWDSIRELTLQSTAPALIHEEGNLIRRSIRDIYSRDEEEIIVAGEDGYKLARDFMKMMIPSHVKKVVQYKEAQVPLFHRYQVESQITTMGEPVVHLKSGGYLVINPTEALVSVDVNSGRSTKERHIEETALKTNLEAAEEVARQLRLRDLGGLVVIDFIDMENRRNNRRVEEKLKNALSTDRARIQIGRISSFGLLELSRQRLNPSLTEAQFEKCPHCQGVGNIRSVDSATIIALRALEDEGIRNRVREVTLKVSNAIALYILNHKRSILADIEHRHNFTVQVQVDDTLGPVGYAVEPVRGGGRADDASGDDEKPAQNNNHRQRPSRDRDEPVAEDDDNGGAASAQGDDEDGQGTGEGGGRSRRRRGRRGGRRRNRFQDGEQTDQQESGYNAHDKFDSDAEADESSSGEQSDDIAADAAEGQDSGSQEGRSSSRGRRGGRGRSRGHRSGPRENDTPVNGDEGAVSSEEEPRGTHADFEASAAPSAEALAPSAEKATAARTRRPQQSARTPADEPPANVASVEPVKAASNDSAEPPVTIVKDYETVNAQSASKKKGWWSRKDD